MLNRHEVAQSNPPAVETTLPEAHSTQTDTPAATTLPPPRRHVLDCVRESENYVFGDERSPIDLEIEKGVDTSTQQRSPGWTARGW